MIITPATYRDDEHGSVLKPWRDNPSILAAGKAQWRQEGASAIRAKKPSLVACNLPIIR
jgi:hypothetical protein